MVKMTELNPFITITDMAESKCMICDVSMVIKIPSEALSLLDIVVWVTQTQESIIGHLVEERKILVVVEVPHTEELDWVTILCAIVSSVLMY
jgi:hypothetical protein